MSFFFGAKVVLFSPMQGKLTYQGRPAAHAKIVRHLTWKNIHGEKETFYANEQGEFSLPIKKGRVRIPLLGELVISQEIQVYYADTEFMIWCKGTDRIDEYGGLGGPLENLTCELTEEFKRHFEYPALFGSSCKWDGMIPNTDVDENI